MGTKCPAGPREEGKGSSDVWIRLRNIGPGTALRIGGVLMPRRRDPQALPGRFSVFEPLPMAPGGSGDIIFREGVAPFRGEERMGGIPPGVFRKTEIPRLALTRRDEAGFKHAAVSDPDRAKRRPPVGFRHEIPEDLRDADKRKGGSDRGS